jgi:hypothetical protein
MRLAPALVLASLGLILTACSKEPDGPKTADEVKAEMADLAEDARPEPGKYRSTIKIINVSIPGMPQADARKMQSMFGGTGQASEHCLTKEMADKGFEEFGKHAAQGNCTYDSFSAGGGKMDAVMTCKTAATVTTRTELHGTFTTTGSNLNMKTESSGGGLPGGKMTMEAEVSSERIGDC